VFDEVSVNNDDEEIKVNNIKKIEEAILNSVSISKTRKTFDFTFKTEPENEKDYRNCNVNSNINNEANSSKNGATISFMLFICFLLI